jgi:hypothetical protein
MWAVFRISCQEAKRSASPSVLFEVGLSAEGGPAATSLNYRIAFLDLEFFY